MPSKYAALPPEAQQEQQAPAGSILNTLLGMGVRIVPQGIGAVAGALSPIPGGALMGGAAGGALGEYLAEKFVDPNPTGETNLKRIGMAGAMGAIPASMMSGALRGAGVGYLSVAGNKKAVEGKGWNESLNPMEWSGSDYIAPVAGGIMGKLLGKATATNQSPGSIRTANPALVSAEGAYGPATPNTEQMTQLALGRTRKAGPATARTLADQILLDAETTKNPRSEVAQQIWGEKGRPGVKDGHKIPQSIVEVESSHQDANDFLAKEKFTNQSAMAKEGAQMTRNENVRRKYIQDQLKQDTTNDKLRTNYLERAATQEARNLNARDKFIAGSQNQEAKNLTARDKFMAREQGQDAKNMLARRKYERGVEIANENALTEDAKRTAATAKQDSLKAQQSKLEALMQGRKKQAPIAINEVLSGKTSEGTPLRGVVQHIDEDLQKANKPPAKAGPPAQAGPLQQVAPTLDRLKIETTRYTNKTTANAIAKQTGGTVNQVGPRRYQIVFEPEQPKQAPLPSEAELMDFPRVPEPAPDAPSSTNYGNVSPEPIKVDNPFGGLTPEEFARYKEVSPYYGNPNYNKEEYLALHNKFKGEPTSVIPVQASSKVAKLAEAGTKDLNLVNEDPIAPMGKPLTEAGIGEAEPHPSMGTQPGEAQGIPLIDRLKAAGEGYGNIKARRAAGEVVNEAERATAAQEAQRLHKEFVESNPDFADIESLPDAQYNRVIADLEKNAIANAEPEMGVQEFAQALSKEGEKPLAEVPFSLEAQTAKSKAPKSGGLFGEGGTTLSAFGAGQGKNLFRIASENPMLATRLATGAGGAAIGASQDKDHPIRGAVLGGAAGLVAPTALKAGLRALRANPNASAQEVESVGKGVKDYISEGIKMLPDWQRFSLLSDLPNLGINTYVGPWGSMMMGALEDAALNKFDPASRGMKAIKLGWNPASFIKKVTNTARMHGSEAEKLLHVADSRVEGQLAEHGPKAFRDLTSIPAKFMTSGDIHARNILMEAGFTPEEARRITLTSEPYTPLGKGIGALKKTEGESGLGSTVRDLMIPFYRTAVNQLEQSAERVPGLGLMMQKHKIEPDAKTIGYAKQAFGGTVGGGAFLLGATLPVPDNPNDPTFKATLKFLSDISGQYGAITKTAFLAGLAYKKGKDPFVAAGGAIAREVPLASTQPLSDLVGMYKQATGQAEFKPPSSVLPGVLNPSHPVNAFSIIGKLMDKGNQSSAYPKSKYSNLGKK